MSKIKLITDSASDISVENEKKYDILIIPFKVSMGDKTYVSRVDFTTDEFYEMMEAYDGLPTTSQITAFEFEEIYKEQYNAGVTDIICVFINSEGSATYNNSVMAKKNFFDNNPDAEGKMTINLIDSGGYTGTYGHAVVEGAKMAQQGESVDKIVDFIRDYTANSTVLFALYSLKYARKSGRIPSAAAFVGDALGLKPIMRLYDHAITTDSKVRGEKVVIPSLVKQTCEEMEPKSPYCVVYGNDLKLKDELTKAMTKELGYPPVDFYQIGAAIAINAGPRLVGVIFTKKS